MAAPVYEKLELRGRRRVFRDREEAGAVLADMLAGELAGELAGSNAPLVLAVPAGGVPVGLEVSRRLAIPFDVLPVRKVQVPGNTEVGFGAVTLDGDLLLNRELADYYGLTPAEIDTRLAAVRADLAERNRLFRGGRPLPELAGRMVVLVDDGLASGYTMLAALATVRRRAAARLLVAVPTAPWRTVDRLREQADAIYCANIRTEALVAVADAYRNWRDLTSDEVAARLGATVEDPGKDEPDPSLRRCAPTA